MNVPLIHNSALWGTNAGKTNRTEKVGEDGLFLRLCILARLKKVQVSSAEADLVLNMEIF